MPAQAEKSFQARHWTTEDGLPDYSVQAILQGGNGCLWIGTGRGLIRFDGVRFTLWDRNNTSALKVDDVRQLAEDGEGNLWIGTTEGLVKKRGAVFTRFTQLDGGSPHDGIGRVSALEGSADGRMWIAHRLGLLRHAGGVFQRFGSPEDFKYDGFRCLHEDREGVLWAGGSWHGLVHLDSSGAFRSVVLPEEMKGYSVGALAAAPNGGLLVLFHRFATGCHLYLYHQGRWEKAGGLLAIDDRSVFLAPARNDDFWMSIGNGSMDRWRDGGFTTFPIDGHRSPFPLCAIEDREGNLWFGTEQAGLHLWRSRRTETLGAHEGLIHENCWVVRETGDGSLWIGTDGGVSRWKDGAFAHFTPANGLPRKDVRAIAEDSEGRVWIGTGAGLACYADGRLESHQFEGVWYRSKVRALLFDRQQQLWVGSASGLHRVELAAPSRSRTNHLRQPVPFDSSRVTTYQKSDGLPHLDISALLEDRSGTLWVGTSGGLCRMTNGRFEPVSEAPSLNVGVLLEDAEGAIWIGVERRLLRFAGGRFVTFSPAEGMPDDMINSLLDDQRGHLWFGGDRGIYRVAKSSFEAVAQGKARAVEPVAYTEADGLLSDETNGQKCQPSSWRTRDGRLWFPTSRGVVVFDPKRLPDNPRPPTVVIEQVRANGLLILGDDPDLVGRPRAGLAGLAEPPLANAGASVLRLEPGEGRLLEIQYTAASFVAPERMRFKYRLDGFDRDWVDAGRRRTAYYTNLRPGDYRFRVIAANGHGVWNETGAGLGLQVAPHFYQTALFRAACGLVVLAGMAGVYRWRVTSLHRAQQREQQAALAAERERIVRDLHDGLGANLTQLTLLAELAEHEQPSESPARRPRGLAEAAHRTARSLKEFLWATQPLDDSLDGLLARICQLAEELMGAASIRCRFDLPVQLPSVTVGPVARKNIALAATEGLNNIARHSGATEVWIRALWEDGTLFLAIEDNGRGFDPSTLSGRGRGLGHMAARIREAGGEFDLESRPGHGTTLRIRVPIGALDR